MTLGGLLVILVMIGALAVIVWRWAMANVLPPMALTFVGMFCGASSGVSLGGVVGLTLGRFIGLAPGSTENEVSVALCLALIGAVVGGLWGLMYVQRRQAQQP